jgi:RHS repeat-associated protein
MKGIANNHYLRVFLVSVFCLMNIQSGFAENKTRTKTSIKPSRIPSTKPASEAKISKEELIGDDSIQNTTTKPTIESKSMPGLMAMSIDSGAASNGITPESLMQNIHFDAYSGTAVISIPILTVPGRKNIAPGIKLNYSPHNGNGNLGIGWQITFPAIERSTKNGIPSYTNNDSFISTLNGGRQELIAINTNEYMARVQGDFTRYFFNGSMWEAHDRNGNVYYFGLDSLLEDDSREGEEGKIFRWKLSEMKDVFDNYYYIRHFANGAFEILYTGEPGTDRDPLNSSTHNFYAKVIGSVGSRPDIISSNNYGSNIKVEHRLEDISVFAGNELQRRYHLEYTLSKNTNRSLLSKIAQFGADNVSTLPPISFIYNDEPTSYALSSITGEPTVGDNLWTVRVDSSYDFGHDCYGPCPPNTMCKGVQWEAPVIQLNGSYSNNSWTGNGRGRFRLSGVQDKATLFSTYIYLKKPKTFTVNYQYGDSSHGVYLNGDYSPRTVLQTQTWNLKSGYNLIEITNYHQHQSYWFDLNFNLADNVDLMNSSQVIQPQFAADFNGDGLTDTASFFNASGTIKVALSNGTSFLPKETWLSGVKDGNQISLGDFNSDSRADILIFDNVNGTWSVSLSDGSKFITGNVWITGFGQGAIPTSGDINGDRKADIIAFKTESGKLIAGIASNQDGYFKDELFTLEIGTGTAQPITGDFNGDGLIDIGSFEKTNGAWKIFINQGGIEKGFTLVNTITSFGAGLHPLITDFNFDGKSDIGYFENGKIIYRIAAHNDFTSSREFPLVFDLQDSSVQVQTGDFNGDALTDFFVYNPLAQQQIAFSNGRFTDLLTELRNGFGGQTNLSYISSTNLRNRYLPFNMPVLSGITTLNNRGYEKKASYNYHGGLWDSSENEFMGFETVQTFDAANNLTESKFRQDDIYLRGLLASISKFDSTGNLYLKTENQWSAETISENDPPVKFIKLDRSDSFVFDGNDTGKRTAVINEFGETPQYGNLTKTTTLGEVDLETGEDIGNDTLIIEYLYHNKTSNSFQLLGAPYKTSTKDKNSSVISMAWMFYDHNDNFETAPDKGLLTKVRTWAGNDSGHSDPEKEMIYDVYGNLINTKSPAGKMNRVEFDNLWHLFPIKVENALGHTVLTEYYGIEGISTDNGNGIKGLWGSIKSVTDINSQKDLSIYDTFGRRTAYISPFDSIEYPTLTTTIDYFDTYSRSTLQKRLSHDENKVIKTVEFYDGLGRPIQSKTPTSVEGRFRVSGNNEYNANGLPEFTYLPFFSFNNQDVIDVIDPNSGRSKTEYDAIRRPVKTINPDGSFSTIEYDDWTTVIINENGHKKSTLKDAFGHVIEVNEFSGSDGRCALYPAEPYKSYAATKYSYDNKGNLTEITDAQGNLTTISYDTLGRKISMNDPDMGIWKYVYDIEGNLIKQTNAKGVSIYFKYDQLNRVVNKTDEDKLNVNYMYDDPSTPFSKGKVTYIEYPEGTTSFVYDGMGREISATKVIDGTEYTIKRSYDALGNIIEVEYPDQEKIFYDYNDSGILQSISNDKSFFPEPALNPNGISLRRCFDHALKTVSFLFEQFIEPYVFGVSEAEATTIKFKTPNSTVISSAIPGNRQVALTWGTVTNATGYNLYYRKSSDTTALKVDVKNSTSHTVTGLLNGVSYTFYVKPYNTYGESVFTPKTVTATPQSEIEKPQAPKLESVRIYGGKIILSWAEVIGAAEYKVYWKDDLNNTNSVKVGNSLRYEIVNLPVGRTYYFAVSAINSAGESGFSNELNVRVPFPAPVAPVLLKAIEGDGSVDLFWTSSENTSGYKIKYGNVSGQYSEIIDAGDTENRHINGLQNGQMYFFCVSAYNDDAESACSNELSALPLGHVPTLYIKNAQYNEGGQITHIEYGNGDVTDYTYNSLNLRVMQIRTVNKNGTALQDLQYEYDAVGNIVKITDLVNSATQQFQYDHSNRLIQAQGAYGLKSFSYDKIGNLLSKDENSYEYSANNSGPHAVTSLSDGSTFAYDLNGNMINRVFGSEGKSVSYQYDNENRLVSAEKDGQQIAFYAYDGDGGRVISQSGNITTKYVGDIFQTNNFGNTRHIFFGSNRVASIYNGKPLYYHTDHLGSTNILSDQNGDVKELFEYHPFGTISRHHQLGDLEDTTQYTYTGKEKDNSTGLYFYNARYYDPALGKFITPDTVVQSPVLNPQSLNRYSYCNNNPINNIDPSGHSWLKSLFKSIGNFFNTIFSWLEKVTDSKWYYDINLGQSYQFQDTQTLARSTGQVIGETITNPWSLPQNMGLGFSRWADHPDIEVLKTINMYGYTQITNSSIEDGDFLFINGILNSKVTAILNGRQAYKEQTFKVAYNPTDGPVADLTEAFLQKLTFTSSFDRKLARMLDGHKNITLAGHSQGGIILGNTLLNLGLRGQRDVVKEATYFNTQISRPRAHLSAVMAGVNSGNISYGSRYFDPSNLAGPNFTEPLKLLSGIPGLYLPFGVEHHGIE